MGMDKKKVLNLKKKEIMGMDKKKVLTIGLVSLVGIAAYFIFFKKKAAMATTAASQSDITALTQLPQAQGRTDIVNTSSKILPAAPLCVNVLFTISVSGRTPIQITQGFCYESVYDVNNWILKTKGIYADLYKIPLSSITYRIVS